MAKRKPLADRFTALLERIMREPMADGERTSKLEAMVRMLGVHASRGDRWAVELIARRLWPEPKGVEQHLHAHVEATAEDRRIVEQRFAKLLDPERQTEAALGLIRIGAIERERVLEALGIAEPIDVEPVAGPDEAIEAEEVQPVEPEPSDVVERLEAVVEFPKPDFWDDDDPRWPSGRRGRGLAGS